MPLQTVKGLLHLIRYRFFVVAGLFPYLAGSASAYHSGVTWRLDVFLLGLFGIASALVAVEAFNEYFDSHSGNDFVFASRHIAPMGRRVLVLGLTFLALAAATGALLAHMRGWWTLGFAAAGGVGVLFYVGPPLRLAYRGLGEAVIAACYGPLMILGAVYIQLGRVTRDAFLLSIPVAVLILALALANEIPDYYQDMLVDKKNIVVRLGCRNAARLYCALLGVFYISLALGISLGALPMLCLLLFATLPVAVLTGKRALHHAETPPAFVPVIRNTLLLFSATLLAITAGFFLGW